MNINASPETVQNIADVFKISALFDDRTANPDKHRIIKWAEQAERHRFTRDDLLDGVQQFYDYQSDRAIQIGDLVHHSRIVKRARLDAEEAERDARRRATADVKAAAETRALATVIPFGKVDNPTERLKLAVEALQTCYGKVECKAAMEEFIAAKAGCAKRKPRKRRKGATA